MLKKVFILFLWGAFLGPLGDMCHVLSQTTTYPEHVYRIYLFRLIPYWVPLLFGSATVLIGVTHVWADGLLRFFFHSSKVRTGEKFRVFVYGAPLIFITVYGLSGYIPYPELMLPCVAFLMWYLLDRTWGGACLGFFTAILGTGFEIFLVHRGIFSYQEKALGLFGVAVWLPWLYVMASISIGNLARHFFKN